MNPSKEIIRRICTIFKCHNCWLHIEEGEISLWLLLDTKELNAFKLELELWTGYVFTLYNQDSPANLQAIIKQHGEQILPVKENTPLKDIQSRRKFTQDK